MLVDRLVLILNNLLARAGSVVEGQKVGRAGRQVGQETGAGELDQRLLELSRGNIVVLGDRGEGGEDGLSELGKQAVGLGVDTNRGFGEIIRHDVEGLGAVDGKEVGKETTDVRRGHRCTADSVGGLVAASPGRENVQSGGEDVDTLAVVGEVCTLVTESGSSNSDGKLGSGRRVRAGILVVAEVSDVSRRNSLSSSNGKVKTRLDGSIDGIIKRLGLAATKRHVGDGTLVLGLASSSELLLGVGSLLGSSLCSPDNTGNDITHGA